MPREKLKQKMLKHRICSVARVISCVSFLVLAIIGVSSIARAMSLESVANQNGIPSSWHIASLGNPDTISVPITYWDQRQDDCSDPSRQFEWSMCQLYAKGIIQGVVQDKLGSDGYPVPTYNNTTDAWNAYHDIFTANLIGNNPVVAGDNFYRWFHETTDENGKQLSKRYDREITFKRTNNNTYEYGSKGTFPLDDIHFSDEDSATKTGHNFHFTAHMTIPMKIAADGSEQFWFSGDDDVWVYLNGQLVLDLGGLHADTEGSFTINTNGDVISTVQNVADQKCRLEKVKYPYSSSIYNSQVESCPRSPKTTTIQTGFKPGDVVNLDFFYAERSTSESNTRITISNMQWPISADSDVKGEIKGKIENSSSNLVEYVSSIKNRDPQYPLYLKRLASYLYDESSATNKDGQTETYTNVGFIPLSDTTLYYSTSLTNPNWQPVEISAPQNSETGFTLANPLKINPAGQDGDTLYFRFFAETSEYTGNITNRTSYYTELDGIAGVTYDHVTLPYTGKTSTEEGGGEDLPQQYELNVEYRIDFGDAEPDPSIQTPPAIEETHDDGYEYSITSPEVPGFVPDVKIVEGKIDGENVKRVVTYTKKPEEQPTEKYKVAIHYVKTDGSNAFPDHVSEHAPGENISVDSQPLEGYTVDPAKVVVENISADAEYTVLYTPIRVNHTVTIHYIYENGRTAHEDYTGEYAEGEEFSITSPVIDGYRRDIAVVSGKMSDHDREFTVIYSVINNVGPITPDIPGYPDQPTPEPELPEPSVPEENDNLIPSLPVSPDDDLTYLGPLGEVAYVPNTGVISDFIAPIFEQYFAEVILSQGFVLAVLLIFAGSFATYFSLRKYLNLNLAPAYTVRSPKMMPKSAKNTNKPKAPRSPRNSKTIKTPKTHRTTKKK